MKCLLILLSLSLLLLAAVESAWNHIYYEADSDLGKKLSAASHEYIAHDVFNTSSPKCASRDGRNVRCFYTTSTNTVGYAIFTDKKLQGVWDYGGNVKDQPQVTDFGFEGNFAFFIDDSHHIVAVGVETNTTFDHTPTIVSPVLFSEAPACVRMVKSTDLFCLARGMDGGAKLFRYRNGTWEEPISIGPNPNGPFGCLFNHFVNTISCWASFGRNNSFSTRIWSLVPKRQTPGWSSFGQYSRGRPCVKLVCVFNQPRALADDNNCMVDSHQRFVGDDVFSEPECSTANCHTYDCFALGKNGILQRMVQYMYFFLLGRASSWTSITELRFKGNPSCVYLRHDQHYHCYMISADNTLYEGVFEVVDPRSGNGDVSVQVAF